MPSEGVHFPLLRDSFQPVNQPVPSQSPAAPKPAAPAAWQDPRPGSGHVVCPAASSWACSPTQVGQQGSACLWAKGEEDYILLIRHKERGEERGEATSAGRQREEGFKGERQVWKEIKTKAHS